MHKGEFALAKIKHQTWRLRLRSFLLGSGGVREIELTCPRECALGKWIYSEGLAKHGDDPQMQDLEREHARMHELAEKMVRLKKEGSEAALQHLQALQSLSDRVMALLTSMGEKLDTLPV
ncbi:MAG TPA: CZB domain-containing protein [Terriglobales bacterium]|nr:CZB domain-containing protein [Terriglobales bacterium]